MESIFNQSTRNELIGRINSLNSDSMPVWGKMNVFRMTRHCNIWSDWVLGKGSYSTYLYKQDLLGKIFGKMALRSNTKDDKPLGKNTPAGKAFLTKRKERRYTKAKKAWIDSIEQYGHFSNDSFIHDFFGKMTEEQIGIFAYKHYDHHLKQFNL